jgi:lactate permease
MWPQDYTPLAHSLGWSSVGAALPMLVLLFMLAVWRKPSWVSALCSLATAIGIAGFLYRMPPLRIVAAASCGAAFGLLPIGWITFNSILLYHLTRETGQFEVIKASLTNLTSDRRLQALLIAFAFGAFIEGAAGSGVPVAVGAAMLAGLGFSPLRAAQLCLLANTAPVAFGAIGTPIVTLHAVTNLPMMELSTWAGRLCAPLSLFIPLYLTGVVGGRKGIRGTLPAAALCGISFATVQFFVSWKIGPQLTDVIASLVAMGCLVALLRVWQPKDIGFICPENMVSSVSDLRTMEAAASVNTGSSLARPVATTPEVASEKPTARELWRAWTPYALLAICVLLWGWPPVRNILIHAGPQIAWPGLHNYVLRMPPVAPTPTPYAAIYSLDWLVSPGTACLLASVLFAAMAGVSPRRFLRVVASTFRQMFFPLVTIASVLSLAFVMNYCGATATLGLLFAATGKFFPFFSPLLGWMGVFLTGSDASSNALFGSLQVVSAHRLGISPVLMAAANSSGGVMGKMISVQTIAVATAAAGLKPSEEGELLRFTFWRSFALAVVIGLLTVIYAYFLRVT